MAEAPLPVETSRHVAASATAVYAVISDVPRMGHWRPGVLRSGWRDGAREPVVGARFTITSDRIWPRRSTSAAVACVAPDRRFAFAVTSVLGLPVSLWDYELEPQGDGVLVTERTTDLRGSVLRSPVLRWLNRGVGEARPGADSPGDGARRLEALARLVEGAAARPGDVGTH